MFLLLILACGPDAVAWRADRSTLTIEPAELVFEPTAVGESSLLPLTVTNTGDARAELVVAVTGPFHADRTGLSLGGGGTASLQVSFRPERWSDARGALTLSGDAELEVALDGPVETDVDGDGADAEAAGGTDCDDADPDVHPGAEDTCGDDLDADCAPVGDDDCDGDGMPADVDCDDADASVHPGAEETEDARDEDCDGRVDEHLVAAGDLVLTELSPLAPAWLEICNVSARAVALDRFALQTDAGALVLPVGTVEADACGAVCASAIAGCAFTAALELDGAEDTVVLAADGRVIDAVAVDATWGWEPGWAWSLDPASTAADANNSPAAWCRTAGSPGEANAPCP